MAIVRRGKSFLWVYKLKGHQMWTKTPCGLMNEAKRVERECLTAMDSRDYSFICPEARETLMRLYTNQEWDFPTGLRLEEQTGKGEQHSEIVLWDPDNKDRGAVQMYFASSLTRGKDKRTLEKYSQCIKHLLRILGTDARMADLWTNDLREYYAKRIEEKASPNTVGWEISTLSGIYGVLIDKKKRQDYHYQQYANKESRFSFTPYSAAELLKQAVALENKLKLTDPFRIDRDALFFEMTGFKAFLF